MKWNYKLFGRYCRKNIYATDANLDLRFQLSERLIDWVKSR